MSKSFIYCFIRKDISIAQQIIQLTHAGYDAGTRWGGASVPPHICLFEVEDGIALIAAMKFVRKHKIKYEMFYEPDYPMGFNALITEPLLQDDYSDLFSEFKMYRSELDDENIEEVATEIHETSPSVG
jgi:hypothetical protein